ncbi:MAG: hypothetical protein EBZ48_14635, partial [Proteobacteria bacterium]|nr:hypothetical protein [Pseudomonadota bacterium]
MTDLAKVIELLNQNRATEAVIHLDSIAESASSNPSFYLLKAIAHLRTFSLQHARDCVTRYRSICSDDSHAEAVASQIEYELTKPLYRAPWEEFRLERIRSLCAYAATGAEYAQFHDVVVVPPRGILLLRDGTIIAESIQNLPLEQVVGDLFYFSGRLETLLLDELTSPRDLKPFGGDHGFTIPTVKVSLRYQTGSLEPAPVDLSAGVSAPPKRRMKSSSQWRGVIEHQVKLFEPGCVSDETIGFAFREAPESIAVTIRGGEIVRAVRSHPAVRTPRVYGFLGLLRDVLARYEIPDLSLVIPSVDLPISSLNPLYTRTPTFGFCSTAVHRCLLLPFARFGRDEIGLELNGGNRTESSWEFALPALERLRDEHPWESRADQAFFAGHHMSVMDVRWRYAELSLREPDRFLCRITRAMDTAGELLNSSIAA